MVELDSLEDKAKQLDAEDPLASIRHQFVLPESDIYLDGNSLGPLSKHTLNQTQQMLSQEWGQRLIRSWNERWIRLPQETGAKIAPLIGAQSSNVICADSVSVNVFKLLAAAFQAQPERPEIVSVDGMFPTDLYIAEGLQSLVGDSRCQLKVVPIDQLGTCISDKTNTLLLSHVNFRTGEAYDLERFTTLAHQHGAKVIWDLSHSVGVLPIQLETNNIDFAVGCGYKFLNGGPGAPAFLFVAPELQASHPQPLSGWMGHREPFQFNQSYEAAQGMDQYLTGTQGILGMTALNAALDIYQGVELQAVFDKSQTLTQFFIELLPDELDVISPSQRGSQVSIQHEHAFAVSQALIDEGIICDYRAPNLVRFGFAPLYIRYQDVLKTVKALRHILHSKIYELPKFQIANTVT